MRSSLVAGLSIACLAMAAPAFGGAVYVPYALDVSVGGTNYETQVWASNRGSENRRFQTYFIGAGQNGTTREDATFGSVGVPPGATVLLTGVAPTDAVGMLEINGAPQVMISARIVPVGHVTASLGANLPVISSENLLAAGTTVHLQGLSRSGGQVTDFVLANIAKQAAFCSVSTLRADGTSLGPAAQLTVAPLSFNRYADFLAALGQGVVSGARLVVSCDQTYYAYAVTFDTQNAAVKVVSPAELLTSALAPPGTTPGPTGCPAGAICFSRPGTFFTQVPPAIFKIEYFDVPPGVYRKVHFRVEVFHGGWGVLSGPGGLHSLFWLVRDRNFDLLGFSVFRKPPRNDVMFRHGIGIEATQKPKIFLPVEGVPGHTYAIDYTYDMGAGRLNYKMIDLTTGQVVADYSDVPNVNQLTMAAGQRLRADFGFDEGRNENEDPGYNWKYSNLTLEVYP